MLNRTWLPALSTLGAALLLSACAAADVENSSEQDQPASSPSGTTEVPAADDEPAAPDGVTAPSDSAPSETAPSDTATSHEDDPEHRGGQQLIIGPDGVEFSYISAEADDGTEVLHLQCRDAESLAAKAGHNDGAQPVGWPQEWDGSGAMPDPLCHPDYLQIDEWEHLEAHTACWEGIETSTLARTGQPQEEIDRALWQQSQARADWEPMPAGGSCAEQWAENDGGEAEDYAERGNANDG